MKESERKEENNKNNVGMKMKFYYELRRTNEDFTLNESPSYGRDVGSRIERERREKKNKNKDERNF